MKPQLFDTIELAQPLPNESLPKGAVGAIIEIFSDPTEAYEVEFTDEDGKTVAQVTLFPDQFMIVNPNNS